MVRDDVRLIVSDRGIFLCALKLKTCELLQITV